MKKTINKIIFILALVILVNIIPTEAKAATYGISFPGSIVYVNMTMGVHYGTSGYTTASNTAYQSDRILINATVTHPEGSTCVWAEVSGWNYIDSDGGLISCIPSNPYVATFNYDSILGDLSSGGANSLRFTTPKLNGTYYIRLLAYAESVTRYVDVPFTVASAPAVETHVYPCTTAGNAGSCSGTEIPQNGSKVTTSAITKNTPIIFTYKATDLNQGFTCTITKPDLSTVSVSPVLNQTYTYPTTGTIDSGSSTATYSFRCNNPKLLAVNLDLVSQITGSAVGVSTYVLPTGLTYVPYQMTSDNIPTEIGFKYYTGYPDYYNNGGNPYALTRVVCSGNCETGQYLAHNTTYISGLASSSSYYIQSYAKNSNNVITWGNARKFTTPGSYCTGINPSTGLCENCAADGKTLQSDGYCR